jgi:hypothetical protein
MQKMRRTRSVEEVPEEEMKYQKVDLKERSLVCNSLTEHVENLNVW